MASGHRHRVATRATTGSRISLQGVLPNEREENPP
jgi:hypothetical protein